MCCGVAIVKIEAGGEVPFLVETFWEKNKSPTADMVFQESDKIYFMENLF